MFQRIRRGLLSAALLSFLWACSSSPEMAQSPKPKPQPEGQELRVGLSPDYPPMAYQENGQLKGLEVDLAMHVSEILHRKLTLVPMPWSELLPALMRGDIDVVMSGMTITPERQQLVAFCDSYMTMGQMAIIRIRDAGRFRTPMQALESGARVGYVNGTTGEAFVNATPVVQGKQGFASAEQGLKALDEGKVDIFIHDAPTSWDLAVTPWADTLISLYRPLTSEALGWAVRKDDMALRTQLNQALARIKSSGQLESMKYRWIPVQIHLEEESKP